MSQIVTVVHIHLDPFELPESARAVKR